MRTGARPAGKPARTPPGGRVRPCGPESGAERSREAVRKFVRKALHNVFADPVAR
ncbi:hypothetical protein GCM10009863_26380 [Streptomyces axinellae]|uniref:Uncharacterized protein n=1 Tax=Streptomyces axinellae TaxID=552788 RepID=A0ABN3Q0M7_9ACTN